MNGWKQQGLVDESSHTVFKSSIERVFFGLILQLILAKNLSVFLSILTAEYTPKVLLHKAS